MRNYVTYDINTGLITGAGYGQDPIESATGILVTDDFIKGLHTHIVDGVLVANVAIQTERKRIEVRYQRNLLLAACDWTQAVDTVLTESKKAEWAAYRQALRDFPETCNPSDPVWPVPPN
jgi:hypothetical protein